MEISFISFVLFLCLWESTTAIRSLVNLGTDVSEKALDALPEVNLTKTTLSMKYPHSIDWVIKRF